ncbi:pre-B-cell leukemia homeobox interacting protein 1b [Austrofundulus limnaeus]|uniref:Pre-B-cell leukemia homeobox interacting protein 1b n=1 Tax=Austrofundulus limnaeus TaxID=52670 RepID=A0A2I4CLM6_AUSLI|nr:PREDICTED: pre-B-cell leukemia transcription factor-interacting protein 1 [Austrofundulus limnaeus]
MSGGSGTNNNWTILTSEETVAETLRPFAAGTTEQHDEGQTSATEPGSGESNQPARSAESAEGLSVGEDPESEQKAAQHRAQLSSHSSPPSLDQAEEVGPTKGQAEGPARPGSDPDPSSDSYTILTPPGPAELTRAEGEETLQEHQLQGAESELQGAESEQQTADAELNEETEERGEPEQRRRKSLLAALEQIGRREEEDEEEEEEFQVPQQENNNMFSLNKCILGVVLLLAFGTIFFSGVFMDLHEESDHSTNDLRDTEAAGNQSPEVPPHVGDHSSQLLKKLAEGNEQISALQAQLQAQNEELKVAKEQAAKGVKERLLWEEVEKENSRMKAEMTSLPVLQKENDRMKRELESVPALQREVETLRSTVSKLKLSSAAAQTQADVSLSSSPPAGQPEDSSQDAAGTTQQQHTGKLWDNSKDLKRHKYETGDKKQPKELEKSARKGGEEKEFKKEWKKEKHEEEKAGKHKKQSGEMKEGKREKSRGDDGKYRKDKEERGWKKGKHEDVNEEWKGEEEKKDREDEKKDKEAWKKVKDGSKEKWERKAWKETGEKEWRDREQGKEGKGKDGRKQDGINDKEKRKQWNDKERKSKDEKQDEKRRKGEKLDERKRGQKEKKTKDWKKDQSHPLKPREEHLYGQQTPPHSHHRPSVAQPEYWLQQRLRLRRRPRPPQRCDSPESCALTQRLLPVTLPEFQAVLQSYLSRAQQAGVDRARTEELRKLAAEFFQDGVFVHEQMSFQDFVEDVADMLEDLVEEEEQEEEQEEDSALEDEMEEFEKEVMMKFSAPGGGEKERVKEEWRKKSRQERG